MDAVSKSLNACVALPQAEAQAGTRTAAELANAHEEILQLRSQMANLSDAAMQSDKVSCFSALSYTVIEYRLLNAQPHNSL